MSLHFLPEDSAPEISDALSAWLTTLGSPERQANTA